MSGTKYVDSEVGPPGRRSQEAASSPAGCPAALPPGAEYLQRLGPPSFAPAAAPQTRRGAGRGGSSAAVPAAGGEGGQPGVYGRDSGAE